MHDMAFTTVFMSPILKESQCKFNGNHFVLLFVCALFWLVGWCQISRPLLYTDMSLYILTAPLIPEPPEYCGSTVDQDLGEMRRLHGEVLMIHFVARELLLFLFQQAWKWKNGHL